MFTVTRITRRDLAALALILLIAAFQRFSEPGILEFLLDEATVSLKAQDMITAGAIPLTGMLSSVGIPNPPITVYVMAIPYLLSHSPQFATLFVAALNVVGVGLLWFMAHRYVGRTAALVAALTYALNPWGVFYSRKIWAQNYHTPIILAGMLLGLYGFDRGKRWAQFLCLPVLVIGMQIHFAAWLLLPVYLWLLWRGRRQIRWPVMAASVLVAALTLAPYAVGLSQFLDEYPDRLSSSALTKNDDPLTVSDKALIFNARLATGLGLETWVAPKRTRDLLTKVPPQPELWSLVGALALVGIAALLWTPARRAVAPLPLLWAGVPLLAFSITWTPVYPHYFVASIPAYCLLIGAGAALLIEKLPGKPFSRLIILAAVGLPLLTQGIWWRGMLRYADSHLLPDGFGTPMHYLLDVRDALTDARDVVVINHGFELLYYHEANVWLVMMRGSADCVRTLPGDGLAVFPARPFAALHTPAAPDNAAAAMYRAADEQIFPLRPGEGSYRVSRFETAPAWFGPELTAVAPVRFGSGAQLTGYRLDSDRMYLEWLLPGPVAEDYHYFGHFLDASGEKLGQRDNILWHGRFWCAGDRLISWADIALPEGTATLRVGLYALRGGQFINDSVLDSAGSPAAIWTDIPLLAEKR